MFQNAQEHTRLPHIDPTDSVVSAQIRGLGLGVFPRPSLSSSKGLNSGLSPCNAALVTLSEGRPKSRCNDVSKSFVIFQ